MRIRLSGTNPLLPPIVTQGPEYPIPHGETVRVASAPRNSDKQDPSQE